MKARCVTRRTFSGNCICCHVRASKPLLIVVVTSWILVLTPSTTITLLAQTSSLTQSRRKKSRDLMFGDRGGQASGPAVLNPDSR